MPTTFLCTLEDGKIKPPKHFYTWVKSIQAPYVKMQLTPIKRPNKAKRSNPQNAYYWAVVIPHIAKAIEEATGEPTPHEKAHEICKAKFLLEEIVMPDTGEILQSVGSTTTLTPSQFSDYLERVTAWGENFFYIFFPPTTL